MPVSATALDRKARAPHGGTHDRHRDRPPGQRRSRAPLGRGERATEVAAVPDLTATIALTRYNEPNWLVEETLNSLAEQKGRRDHDL